MKRNELEGKKTKDNDDGGSQLVHRRQPLTTSEKTFRPSFLHVLTYMYVFFSDLGTQEPAAPASLLDFFFNSKKEFEMFHFHAGACCWPPK